MGGSAKLMLAAMHDLRLSFELEAKELAVEKHRSPD